jgi:hypothetical protein
VIDIDPSSFGAAIRRGVISNYWYIAIRSNKKTSYSLPQINWKSMLYPRTKTFSIDIEF